jgi:hypothetical protein
MALDSAHTRRPRRDEQVEQAAVITPVQLRSLGTVMKRTMLGLGRTAKPTP